MLEIRNLTLFSSHPLSFRNQYFWSLIQRVIIIKLKLKKCDNSMVFICLKINFLMCRYEPVCLGGINVVYKGFLEWEFTVGSIWQVNIWTRQLLFSFFFFLILLSIVSIYNRLFLRQHKLRILTFPNTLPLSCFSCILWDGFALSLWYTILSFSTLVTVLGIGKFNWIIIC